MGQALGEPEMESLLRACRTRDLPAGSQVFSPLERAERFYVILAGQVKVYKLSAKGNEQILHLYGAGQTFGEAAMWTVGSFPAHAAALAATTVPTFAGVTVYKDDSGKYVKIGGRIQLQYHQVDPDNGSSSDELFFRRLRPYIEGSLHKYWLGKFQLDMGKAEDDNDWHFPHSDWHSTEQGERAQAEYGAALYTLLFSHPAVEAVTYAGLDSSPYKERAARIVPKGAGALFTVALKGGYDACVKLVNSVNLFSYVANLGDARSLIIHSASTTHRQLSDEQRAAAGAADNVVRVSIGIEDADECHIRVVEPFRDHLSADEHT